MNKFEKLVKMAEALDQGSKHFTDKDATAVKGILLPFISDIASEIIDEDDKVVYSTFGEGETKNGKSMTVWFEVDTSSINAEKLLNKLKNYSILNKDKWSKIVEKVESLGYHNSYINPFEFAKIVGAKHGFVCRLLIPYTVNWGTSNEACSKDKGKKNAKTKNADKAGIQVVESLGSCKLASGGNWLTSFTDVKVLRSALEKLTSLNPPKLVDNSDCKSVILSLIKTKGLKDKVLQIIDRLTVSTGGDIKQFQTKFMQEVNDLLDSK